MSDTYISDAIKYIGVDDTDIDLFESQYVVPNGVSLCNYRWENSSNGYCWWKKNKWVVR